MNPETDNINQNFTEEESSFDFQKWLHLFIKNWYLFLIFITIFLIGGYLKNRSWMPLYQSNGTLIIKKIDIVQVHKILWKVLVWRVLIKIQIIR
jgi:hypothetical protein